jgi:hypothetical protein
MPARDPDLVIRMLRDAGSLRGWTPRQFDLLMRQADAADLLGRLAVLAEAHGLTPHLPPGLQDQLSGTRRLMRSHAAEVQRELGHIRLALHTLQVPVVLLKGAAYVAAGLPTAQGRFFSDVDLLVPKARLADVEDALLRHGWVTTHRSAYDQRYYRQWMHELPPMLHIRRQTALDVHHAIAPETSRWRTDSALLWAQARAVPDGSGYSVLAPTDMVLHSMVHLFLNEELSHGLRDLADIDQLLRHFGSQAGFWPQLLARADELGLRRALHHGLRCASEILGTPVPADTLQAVAGWGPGRLRGALMQAAWRRVLRTPHASTADFWTPLARFALYVRATGLRMPPLLLARHLAIKALGLNKPHGPGSKPVP